MSTDRDTRTRRVAVAGLEGDGGHALPYSQVFPFHPDTAYPEYRLGASAVSPRPNPAYAATRKALHLLGIDAERFGTADWNPLGDVIRPGDRVFLKPNLVTHEYRRSCGCAGDLFSVITHPSVIRAVADYVAIALGGEGELIIGDNPCIDADFDALHATTRLRDFAGFYREHWGTACRVIDLRPMRTDDLTHYGFRSKVVTQPGDPRGASIIDLGAASHLQGLSPLAFRGVFTDRWETIRHHAGGRHRYSLSNTIVDSDVYLSVPKLKAHHKVGATLNVKGLVGVNSNKNHLVHWRQGFPSMGGDEYPRAYRALDPLRLELRHVLRDLLPERLYIPLRQSLLGTALDRALGRESRHGHERYRGAWQGNDTCWRMAADLYDLFVADRTGWRAERGQRPRFFSVVDGIVGGEGNGPFCPLARSAGVVVAGEDLLAVDRVCVRLMDYDRALVRYLDELMREHGLAEQDIAVLTRPGEVDEGYFDGKRRYLQFRAPDGWPDLELNATVTPRAPRERPGAGCA